MEEKLVSYEVAQLAHKLGFDEKVMCGIKEGGELFAGRSGAYDWNGDKTTTCLSCPTHGHLYKWIRKHGVYIDIETIIYRGKVSFRVVIQYGECLKCVKVLPKNYECYDEAWDAGLLYALRLIFECHTHHCKHDDCCEEREHCHEHEHCEKREHCEDEHEHCEHEHKHCEEHEHHEDCDHEHGHECCREHKEEHSHEEHHEHHEHSSFEITPGGLKAEESEDSESDKKSHDKKSDKGK
jgi:hypothetical protein